jgi:pseudouridine kinase
MTHGEPFEQAVRLGMAASMITLQTSDAIADITIEQLYSLVKKITIHD